MTFTPPAATTPPAILEAVPAAAPGSNGAAAPGSRGVARLNKPLRAFGYTVETLEVMLAPMAKAGADPLGSMGNDAPLAHIRCEGAGGVGGGGGRAVWAVQCSLR